MASPSLTFTGHLLSRSCCANTNSSSTSFRTVRAPCVPSQGRSGTYRPQISFFKPGHGGMRAKKQHPVGLSVETRCMAHSQLSRNLAGKRGIFCPPSFWQCSTLEAQAKYLPLLKWPSRGLHTMARCSRPALPLTPTVAPRRHRHTDRRWLSSAPAVEKTTPPTR
jgi:hypothetical protein